MRKFADKQRTNRKQTENSKTEATLILCGSSGKRANNYILFIKQKKAQTTVRLMVTTKQGILTQIPNKS